MSGLIELFHAVDIGWFYCWNLFCKWRTLGSDAFYEYTTLGDLEICSGLNKTDLDLFWFALSKMNPDDF